MDNLVPQAAAISTYGLYAIIVILSGVIAHLYKKVSMLEKEMREQLRQAQLDLNAHDEQNRRELAALVTQSNAVTERNTAALNEINSYFRNAALANQRPSFVTIPPSSGPNV